jgi:iron complex outermembrane receptor protein
MRHQSVSAARSNDEGKGESGFRARAAFFNSTAVFSILAAGTIAVRGADATATNSVAGSLADLSVEQLMDEPVTSVSLHQAKLNESAAAIAVITQDDIRRWGITSIPDALRLVPGLDVAQINSHDWAVSARGFNNEFANKLLVLIDGRSVYGTGFGGVVWGVQDVVLEDVDRIEVIRGPGASLWGANAENGVINIITKSAAETQGALISVTGGTLDQPITTVRYGGRLATNIAYRVYGKIANRDGLETANGQDAPDRALEGQAGARLDWDLSSADTLTAQGDYYRERVVEDQQVYSLMPPFSGSYNEVDYNSGGNALARWTHDFSDTSSFSLQAYYERFKQEQADGAAESTGTTEVDGKDRFVLGNRNEVTWGFDYRHVDADFRGSPYVSWYPATYRDQLIGGFLQDEISLVPDRLKLTIGSKFEHNDLSGFEVEPTARLWWRLTDRQSVWAAVSRAVRTPAWSDLHSTANLDVIAPQPPAAPLPVQISELGNPSLDEETVVAYEAGYRAEPAAHVSLDVAAFFNDYDELITSGPATTKLVPAAPPYVAVTTRDGNNDSGYTYGLEASARWDVTGTWHLTASYSWLGMNLATSSAYLQSAPAHQAQLRSALDLPGHFELNSSVAFVDKVNASYGIQQVAIPSYVRVDVGLIWHATPNLELGVWGQNLAQDRHAEFTSYKSLLITEIPRSVMGRITFRF